MKTVLFTFIIAGAIAVIALSIWRQVDQRADRAEMDRLLAMQPSAPSQFTADMVSGLPEPARRYFTFAITEGTSLFTVAQIEMQGQFSLGNKDAPNYLNIEASQALAAPPQALCGRCQEGLA